MAIPRTENLNPDEASAEAEFARQIESDVDGNIRAYLDRFGAVINTDNAKLLYAPYADDPLLRAKFSRATYAPAKWLMNECFDRLIKDDSNEVIYFMAGGTASGKSSCVEIIDDLFERSDLMIDGTMSNFALADRQISLGIEREKMIRIIYVHCKVDVALARAIDRALKINRALSLNVFAGSHFQCPRTMLALYDKFFDNPKFEFLAIESGDISKRIAPQLTRGFLNAVRIEDLEILTKSVYDNYVQICKNYEYDTGKQFPSHLDGLFLSEGRAV